MADILVDTPCSPATTACTTGRLLAPLRELPVDRAVAERAGRIVREFGARLPDALVAATALEHRLALSTRNPKHFEPISGLRLRTP